MANEPLGDGGRLMAFKTKMRAGAALAAAILIGAVFWAWPAGAAPGSGSGGKSTGGASQGAGSAGGGQWWLALDGRVYSFADTDVLFSVKDGKLKSDWQYMMGAGYPVEPVKFRSPQRLAAWFDFDCGVMKLKFKPDLSAFSVSVDLWETGSHCETITGVAVLKRPR